VISEEDRQGLFDAVKKARAILKQLPVRKVSDKTAAEYHREFARMHARGAGDLRPEAGTTSKRTYYRRRAALTWGAQQALEQMLREQDRAQKAGDWNQVRRVLASMTDVISLLERYPPQREPGEGLTENRQCPIENPAPRKSKKAGLAKLPADWREQLWSILPPASKYRSAIAVLELAGARPSELVAGVDVVSDGENLHITIYGTKRGVDGQHGRESRTITLAVDTPQAKWLWRAAAESTGGVRVTVESAKRLADEVARLGRRLWPRKRDTVSPYTYRHAFAADVKTQHPEDWDTIAAALGHSVPETQRHYGRAKQSRGGGGRFLGIAASESPKGQRAKKPYPRRTTKVAPSLQG
jgi:integrase